MRWGTRLLWLVLTTSLLGCDVFGVPYSCEDCGPWPVEPCAEGCVEGACEAFWLPAPPAPESGADELERLLGYCTRTDDTDDAGRPVLMSCWGQRNVTLEWDGEQLVRLVHDERHPRYEVIIETAFRYDAEGRFTGRTDRVLVEGVEQSGSSYDYEWEGDVIVRQLFRRWAVEQFAWPDGEQSLDDPGFWADGRFTDGGVERGLEERVWDVDGHELSWELRAGLAEVLVESRHREWADDGRLLTEVYERFRLSADDDEAPPGCEVFDPLHYQCTTTYEHDANGNVSGWVGPDGERVTASDNCCVPGCVPDAVD